MFPEKMTGIGISVYVVGSTVTIDYQLCQYMG